MEESIEEKAKRDAEKLWEEKLKDQFESKMNLIIKESMENFQKQISDFEKTINKQIDELVDNSNMDNYNNNNYSNFNNIINNNANNISNSNNNNYNKNNNYYNNNNNSNFKYNNNNNFNFNNNNNYNNNFNNNSFNNFNNDSNNNFNYHNNKNNNFNNSYNNINNYNDNNNNDNNNNFNYNNSYNNNFNNNNNNYNNNQNNINNNNNNNYNNNFNNSNSNINIENDNILRKKQIHVFNIQKPSIVNLVQFNDTNTLINLILQCLANIKTLIAYYFNPEKEMKILKKSMENPNGVYLGGPFLKFLDNIWKSSKTQYNPYEIHQSLQKLMGNYYSNDPGFIFNFILTQLHNELIQIPNINKVEESLDDNLCLQNFFQFFKLNATKILSSFSNNYKIQKRCQFCNQIQYLYESSFVLDIFLEANNENNLSSNKIYLIENLKTLLIDMKNKNIVENCINCHAPKNKFVNKSIYTTSEILIININRNKDINSNISLEYPFQFNGSEINENVSQYKYELITIIKKFNNNNFFQFVAYCKSFVNKKWYLYNNQNIELVQNENELIDDKNACLLIYSFINSN